jgi:hypothetical protein
MMFDSDFALIYGLNTNFDGLAACPVPPTEPIEQVTDVDDCGELPSAEFVHEYSNVRDCLQNISIGK